MAVVKVYTSDNYILVEDGTNIFEYAKGYTTYTFKDSVYTIKETVGGEYKFTQGQITSGDVRKEDNSSYTEATFKTFLRQNTGFKTAAGGSAATPIGALLTKSGQTTAYRTGDDGDIEAGRLLLFDQLASNNPFGNSKRFTDELGGQVYTKEIVIDWSTFDGATVLGYYRKVNGSDITWNAAIDAALAFSPPGFTSGWRLPNKREMENIANYQLSFIFNYSPFNLPSNSIWLSTTYAASTSIAYLSSGSWINLSAKSGLSARWIAVRTFTVTGTTLS